MHPKKAVWQSRRGFSLVELLVAVAILVVVLYVITNMISQTSKAWQYSSTKVTAFQSARDTFQTITRAVSNATLNTYYDYYDQTYTSRTKTSTASLSTFVPYIYGRYSELEFTCGKSQLTGSGINQYAHAIFFQAPTAYTSGNYPDTQGLLNVIGYYVDFGSDNAPAFITQARYRFRLKELLVPTENFGVYNTATYSGHAWFTSFLTAANVHPLADNIVALVIWPKLSTDTTTTGTSVSALYPGGGPLSPDYEYDSNIANYTPPQTWSSGSQPPTMNQLPPLVHITMIAVDETSMSRLQGTSTVAPNLGFDYTQVFQLVSNFDSDSTTVSTGLTSKHLGYRIFQTDVPIHSAKWSP